MGVPDWWLERRFGLLVHANLASVPAWAPIGQYADWYRAHIDGTVPDVLLHPSPLAETLAYHRDQWPHIERYDDFFPFLTFDEWDADAWAALARDTGMGYAVMMAKHHDGLCWWDAPGTDHTVLRDGPARNVLAEFAAACERVDLPFGTHYSLLDWSDERYPSCAYVDEVVHPQVLDLVGRYGSKMLWGDGHWGGGGGHWRSDELIKAALEIEPALVVNDRWWADAQGVRTYEYRMPDEIVAEPWELRRGLGASLGLNRAETADHLATASEIVAVLTEVVAKGGHLLLAVGSGATGRIPDLHADRLRVAGGWIRRHQELVDRSTPWTSWGDDDCRYLVLDGSVHAIDVSGRGRFAALARSDGRVTAIETLDGQTVPFERSDDDLHLVRPPRKSQRLPVVYRIAIDDPPAAPIALFPDAATAPIDLAERLRDAGPGTIVQLGEATYLGPARIPDGVTVRGLGPDRTRIDGMESTAVAIGANARLEHCSITGGGRRIAWLPKVVAHLAGHDATLMGCRVDGHVEINADDGRIISSTLTGVVARDVERVTVNRSTCHGMQWDWAIDLTGGSGHQVESCEFSALLAGVRLTDTVGATVRGNRIRARWWGVHLIDTEATHVIGNAIEHTMRAVDVDGGTQAVVTGNAVRLGDSGCVVQGGAADSEVSGNHWENCRVGLIAWDASALRHRDNTCIALGEPERSLVVGP